MNTLVVEYRKVETVIPFARNPRTHSEAQVAKIAASIVEYGFTNPLLVDGDNGLIAGHCRSAAARKLGLAEVPVIELGHLSPTQKRAYVIGDNQLALQAGWDEELLALELAELQEAGYDLALTGFDDAEIERLLAEVVAVDEEAASVQDEAEGADEVPDTPANPVSRPGDVWQIKKPAKNDLHPTMKPVELVERAIRNSSRPGDVVLDPFGGSGTTLIAAEKSGRQARLIELDPKYCDVIVRRWQAFAGAHATRASDGESFPNP